jgi:hypothetical protein
MVDHEQLQSRGGVGALTERGGYPRLPPPSFGRSEMESPVQVQTATAQTTPAHHRQRTTRIILHVIKVVSFLVSAAPTIALSAKIVGLLPIVTWAALGLLYLGALAVIGVMLWVGVALVQIDADRNTVPVRL